jgi:hypothetical protein
MGQNNEIKIIEQQISLLKSALEQKKNEPNVSFLNEELKDKEKQLYNLRRKVYEKTFFNFNNFICFFYS